MGLKSVLGRLSSVVSIEDTMADAEKLQFATVNPKKFDKVSNIIQFNSGSSRRTLRLNVAKKR